MSTWATRSSRSFRLWAMVRLYKFFSERSTKSISPAIFACPTYYILESLKGNGYKVRGTPRYVTGMVSSTVNRLNSRSPLAIILTTFCTSSLRKPYDNRIAGPSLTTSFFAGYHKLVHHPSTTRHLLPPFLGRSWTLSAIEIRTSSLQDRFFHTGRSGIGGTGRKWFSTGPEMFRTSRLLRLSKPCLSDASEFLTGHSDLLLWLTTVRLQVLGKR